jgi:hypothetical protein
MNIAKSTIFQIIEEELRLAQQQGAFSSHIDLDIAAGSLSIAKSRIKEIIQEELARSAIELADE